MTATAGPVLDAVDLVRLAEATALIEAHDTESVLATAMRSLGERDRGACAEHVWFAHAAVLVFPRTLDGLRKELMDHGIETAAMIPGGLLRSRLSARYDVPGEHLAVGILHATVIDRSGNPCELEISAVVLPPELAHIAADERRYGQENHLALVVPEVDFFVLCGLRSTIAAHMQPAWGWYNDYEDRTGFFFRDVQHPLPAFCRLGLFCAGQVPELLAVHQRESAAARCG